MNHEATVTYQTHNDLIWLTCTCGWKQAVDHYPSLTFVNWTWDKHVAGVSEAEYQETLRRYGIATDTEGAQT